MKKPIQFICAVFVLVLSSCNVGVKKDLGTGLEIKNVDLSIGEAFLSVDGKKLTASSVAYGSEVVATFTGLDGFTLKNGMAFLDASISVKDKAGKVVGDFKDLFKAYDSTGIKQSEVKEQITLSLTCLSPLKVGQEYVCEFQIKDKNGKGVVTATNTLKMQELVGTEYKENGLTVDGIYYTLNDNESALEENSITLGDMLKVHYSGLSGLKEENGMVWIDAGIKFTDEAGTIILEKKDLFADYDSTGIPAKDVKNSVYLDIKADNEIVATGKQYKGYFYLKDKKGTAEVNNSFNFKVK
ncbi:MAG TPA: hypothetical protein VNX68_00790 [Nitrosopumilaceae archaeon]|nr:hypothetical protein [Nitrosopumilaceae archaeon]